MTQWDEELGLPGNREIVEHALCRSTTQALHLAEETGSRNRTLAERAADLVRGFECGPAAPPARPEPELPAVPPPAGRVRGPDTVPHAVPHAVPPGIAEELLHAGTGVNAVLAGGLEALAQDVSRGPAR
ncbi:MAG TPA: hypothetical protein VGP26_03030 [Actinophytocola sp.]|jgi:hypothetical protein|nr:hypothetical protein [Actinophytocola sp.]